MADKKRPKRSGPSDHKRPSQSSGERIAEGERKPGRELLLLVQGGSAKTPSEIADLAMEALVRAGAIERPKEHS